MADLPNASSIESVEAGGNNPVYYFTPYNYVGLAGPAEASHQPTATTSDTPFSHSPTQYFDASAVVFSDTTIVQHGTSSGLPTPPGTSGNDAHLRSGVFYH